ncbi:hypothetical protein [Lysinibacillus pakistanensis]|uniref:hypothetical protein n=1 Tax=Lysinibacillus pakistanensis TaxID=759811 RepID=UPI003D2C3590
MFKLGIIEEVQGYTDLKNTPFERTIVIKAIVMHLLEDYADQLEDNEFGLFFYVGGNIKSVTNEEANKRLKSILNKLIFQEITCHGLRHTQLLYYYRILSMYMNVLVMKHFYNNAHLCSHT